MLIICILTLLYSCNFYSNKETDIKLLQVSLRKVFIEDTILFKRMSFEIKFENQSNSVKKLIFKREHNIYNKIDTSSISKENASLEIFNRHNNKISELRLSLLYPKETVISKMKSVDLLFILNDDMISTAYLNYISIDKSSSALIEMLKNSRIVLKFYDSKKMVDSVEVKMPPDFSIYYGSPLIKDLK